MIIDHLFPKTFYGRYFQLLEKRQNPLKNEKNDCFCNNTTNKIKITASMKNKQHLFTYTTDPLSTDRLDSRVTSSKVQLELGKWIISHFKQSLSNY